VRGGYNDFLVQKSSRKFKEKFHEEKEKQNLKREQKKKLLNMAGRTSTRGELSSPGWHLHAPPATPRAHDGGQYHMRIPWGIHEAQLRQ
jgi:hypothetical protein